MQQGNRRKRASLEAVFVIDVFIFAVNIEFSEKYYKTILKKSVFESFLSTVTDGKLKRKDPHQLSSS